jgi:hypothetical protein
VVQTSPIGSCLDSSSLLSSGVGRCLGGGVGGAGHNHEHLSYHVKCNIEYAMSYLERARGRELSTTPSFVNGRRKVVCLGQLSLLSSLGHNSDM